jgi:Protein of unknown function (DUF2442)
MMKLHTINRVKSLYVGRLQVFFDDGSRPVIDLSPMLAQGGVFAPLRDLNRFEAVEVGPHGRSLLWRIGDDVVDLCADALWLMVHPEDRLAVAKAAATAQPSSEHG